MKPIKKEKIPLMYNPPMESVTPMKVVSNVEYNKNLMWRQATEKDSYLDYAKTLTQKATNQVNSARGSIYSTGYRVCQQTNHNPENLLYGRPKESDAIHRPFFAPIVKKEDVHLWLKGGVSHSFASKYNYNAR